MKWADVSDIVIALVEQYPDVNPSAVRFTDLHNWVVGLLGFDDDHARGGERVLEAIQAAWMDEID